MLPLLLNISTQNKSNQEEDGSWNPINQSEIVWTYSGNCCLCMLCCVPICAWLSASICDDWRSTVYDAVSHWSRRQSGIARCVGHFVIGLFSVERTGLQSGHAWLLLYKGHVWRYCFMVRFSQKLQVTLKNKAGKTLGCCDLDGMFVWVVHIVFANRCDASHRAVARHESERSCCDDTNNQIPHA